MLKTSSTGRWQGFCLHVPPTPVQLPEHGPQSCTWPLTLALPQVCSGRSSAYGPLHRHLPSHCQCKNPLGAQPPGPLHQGCMEGAQERASWGPRPAPGTPCTSPGQSCGPSGTGARCPPQPGCAAVWPAGQGAGGGAAGRAWSGPRHASGRGTPCAAVGRAGRLRDPGEAVTGHPGLSASVSQKEPPHSTSLKTAAEGGGRAEIITETVQGEVQRRPEKRSRPCDGAATCCELGAAGAAHSILSHSTLSFRQAPHLARQASPGSPRDCAMP